MPAFIYDAGAGAAIRADGSVAVTATATDAIDIAVNATGVGMIVLNVNDIVTTVGDETYVFSVVTRDSAGANAVTQLTIPAITETGTYYIPFYGEGMVGFDADAAQIGVTATLGGAAPSVTYSAFLNPVRGAGRP